MVESISPEQSNRSERGKKLRKRLLILAVSATIAASSVGAASGAGHAFLSNPMQFLSNTAALIRGDMGARSYAKDIVANSGRAEICQQSFRQAVEATAGRGQVADLPRSILGYVINNESICFEGLTGLNQEMIDTSATFDQGFPQVADFDRTIEEVDGVTSATYFRDGEYVATITNLDGTVSDLTSPDDYKECIHDEACRTEIVSGGSPMASGYEDNYNPDEQWPYLWWTADGQTGTYLHTNITEHDIIDDPSYVTVSYVDGDYQVGMMTQDRLDEVNASGGWAFVSPFNFRQGGEITAQDIFDAGAVFKNSGIVAICENDHGSYVMSIAGLQGSEQAAQFFMSAGYALSSPTGNCATYDDEGSASYTVNGRMLTDTTPDSDVEVIRISENTLNPFVLITPQQD